MEPKYYEPYGPFTFESLTPGSRYELEDGHPVYQAATGGDGANTVAAGVVAISSDPEADETGVDPGYVIDEGNVRAPDIAVGNVPDQLGFISGVPSLALEYAGSHQDEVKLQDKIARFLSHGTRWVWVVRLIGPRRVEVYERNRAVTTVGPGQTLTAPGVLQLPVPVEALFVKSVAQKIALRNLLAREGYSGLEAVREEGRDEGREEQSRAAVVQVLEARGLEVSDELRAKIAAAPREELRELLRRAATLTAGELLG